MTYIYIYGLDLLVTLAPFVAAPLLIQFHAGAALFALLAGCAVMLGRKGTRAHRRAGWVFATAMAAVAVSSLFITRNGSYSAIHLLTILTLITLPSGLLAARHGRIRKHRSAMISLFVGLAVAGAFTLLPGRLMHRIAFSLPAAAR